jgi:hypothetical protein
VLAYRSEEQLIGLKEAGFFDYVFLIALFRFLWLWGFFVSCRIYGLGEGYFFVGIGCLFDRLLPEGSAALCLFIAALFLIRSSGP